MHMFVLTCGNAYTHVRMHACITIIMHVEHHINFDLHQLRTLQGKEYMRYRFFIPLCPHM